MTLDELTRAGRELSPSARARLRDLPLMSATIMEFADPVLRGCGDVCADDLRTVLDLASIAWNASMTNDEGEPEDDCVDGWRERLAQELDSAPSEQTVQFTAPLVQRKRELFPDDPRHVGNVEVLTDGAAPVDVRISVADTPRLRAYLNGPEQPNGRAELAPRYRDFVRRHRVDHRFLVLEFPNPFPPVAEYPQHRLHLRWHSAQYDWEVPTLTEFMRGDGVPPRDPRSQAFTDRYVGLLFDVEHAVLRLARSLPCVPSDREIRETYRAIRRHPDGDTRSPLATVVWQALAFSLAKHPYSAREVDAVLLRLEHSVRFHERWPGGTEYVTFLRAMLLDGRSG